MPFTEEVPPNRVPSMPCKRRSCPHQKMLIRQLKLSEPAISYFTYQCDDAAFWVVCRRCIDPNAEKGESEQPKQKPKAVPQVPEPEPVNTNRCNEYPAACVNCTPKQWAKCDVVLP